MVEKEFLTCSPTDVTSARPSLRARSPWVILKPVTIVLKTIKSQVLFLRHFRRSFTVPFSSNLVYVYLRQRLRHSLCPFPTQRDTKLPLFFLTIFHWSPIHGSPNSLPPLKAWSEELLTLSPKGLHWQPPCTCIFQPSFVIESVIIVLRDCSAKGVFNDPGHSVKTLFKTIHAFLETALCASVVFPYKATSLRTTGENTYIALFDRALGADL